MTSTPCEDLTPRQRCAVAVYWIMRGRKWTTRQWAAYFCISERTVNRIMADLSALHEFALTRNDAGQWVIYMADY